MKRIVKYILHMLALPIIYTLAGIGFDGNHVWMIMITSIGTFLVAWLIQKGYSDQESIWAQYLFILPFWTIFLVLSIYGSDFSRTGTYLVAIPILAYIGNRFGKTSNYYLLILMLIMTPLIGFIILPNHFVLLNNHGARTDKILPEITLLNSQQDTVQINQSGVVVLDFWTTSCGICFKQFPDYEKYYLEFLDDSDVEMYSVNVPLKRDEFSETVSLVRELGYEFPTLYASSHQDIKDMGVKAYPHLIILKDGKIRYSGRLEMGKNILINHLKDEILRLKRE